MEYIKYGHHISYKNVFKIFLIYFFIFIPILLLRYPDIRNELKYFVITDNILETKNYFILKYFSELYPDKPPLFFWILVVLKRYCNTFFLPASIFIGSVLPSFLITVLSYSLFAKIKDEKAGFIISLFLCTTPFFIGTSLVLRMDILMSFFIFMALYNFFSIYYNFIPKNFKNIFFLYTYIFLAVFTKGLAGIIVPFITILIFLILENNLKFLKEIYFGKGIVFLIILTGLWWYYIIKFPEGKDYLSLILKQEAAGRVLNAKTHVKPFYYYLKMLPILLYPYGIFFVGSLVYYIKNIKSYKNFEPLEKIGLSWTVFPIIAFSSASGKLDIYLIPMFTGMFVMVYMFILKTKNSKFGKIIFKISMFTAVVPLVFNKFFNREDNFYKKIMYFPITIIIIFILFIPFTEKYNEKYSLKSIEHKIIYSDKTLIAYKFKDFINISGKINRNILLVENYAELEKEVLENKNIMIVTKRKYKKDLEKLNQMKLQYENLNYIILSS